MCIKHFPLLIPGAASNISLEVSAPFDQQKIATIAAADKAAVDLALSHAEKLHKDRTTWLSAAQRIEILDKAAQIMMDRSDELAMEAAREGGKPLLDSKVEVARAIDGIRICTETLRTDAGEEIPMGVNGASLNRLAFTSHEPIGVVVAVSAFNHPLNLAVHQVAPAVATGCPVIIKPAEDTPLSCYRFVQILHEAGLPKEWCQALVVDDLSVATQLVSDERVDFFSFIGSAAVGWMLRSQLSPGTRCALEHGGVAPVIMTKDADCDAAIPLLAKGGLYHAGQVCVSVQRIFVENDIKEQLLEGLIEQANNMTVGDPTLATSDIGPLIRPPEVDRVESWVNEAKSAGATVHCGGKRLSNTCYAPTILSNAPMDAKVSFMEVFGPVVMVYGFDDIDDAIKLANDVPFSFQASVFTNNLDTAMKCYKQLNASAVMINDFTAFRVDWMPFAGLKVSGLGVGGIPHTMKDMQIEKMMVIKSDEL